MVQNSNMLSYVLKAVQALLTSLRGTCQNTLARSKDENSVALASPIMS